MPTTLRRLLTAHRRGLGPARRPWRRRQRQAREPRPGAAAQRAGISSARTLGGPHLQTGRDARLGTRPRPATIARRSAAARRSQVVRRRAKRCGRAAKATASAAAGPLYWGASIGNQLTGDQAPWDMGAVSKFEGLAGKGVSLVNFFSPFADCSVSPCSFYKFPTERRWKASARTARSRSSAGASQSIPSSLDEPELPARRRDRRHLRLLHPRIRRRRPRLGPPLLPPLQLGDERQLVPLVGGRQRQPARRVRRRLAPRARHLHRGRGDQRDLGLVPQRRPRGIDAATSPRSTPATPTSTGPASTATTGAPTRPRRTAGRSFDELFNVDLRPRSSTRSRRASR